VLAALLQSQLPIHEMRELLSGMARDANIFRHLDILLHDIEKTTWRDLPSDIPELIHPSMRRKALVADVSSFLQLNGIGRSELLTNIIRVRPEFQRKKLGQKAAIPKIVATFLADASAAETAMFLDRIGYGIKQDPYLQGILQRK
jgi:hypothetical protein